MMGLVVVWGEGGERREQSGESKAALDRVKIGAVRVSLEQSKATWTC